MATELNHTLTLQFERDFDEASFQRWMSVNWSVSVIFAALYVIVIFAGKAWMKRKPRFEIRSVLAAWSGFLATFSIIGMVRIWTEFSYVMKAYGLKHSVCSADYFMDPVTSLWSALFTLSKVVELGDTGFIVLRKQKLIFLHWYHHVTVMIYCFYSYAEHTSAGRWFMMMNYVVHSFMYVYYTLRALQYRLPKWVNIGLTTMQLSQMVVGCIINLWTYQIRVRGEPCDQSWQNIRVASIMYLSYFVLFGHFFYNTYVVVGNKDVFLKVEKKAS